MAWMKGILILGMACAGLASASQPVAREWKAPDGSLVRYRWSEPGKIEPGRRYPLVLFLHGSGERGDDNRIQVRHGVRPILDAARRLGEPCFLIAPQCPDERWWSPMDAQFKHLVAARQPNPLLDPVLALVDEIMATRPVDPRRFYVTGLSMGGFATWDLLGRVPDKIAAAIPICGGGDPSLAASFKHVPIHAFHGEIDPEVPVSATREMIAALRKAGGEPKVTYFPDEGHVCWPQVYDNIEVIRWLFAQRRK
jgi:predicted peptidase